MKSAMMMMITAVLGTATLGSKAAVPENFLVSADKKETTTATGLQKEYPFVKGFIRNGFTAYVIKYNTSNAAGKTVVASGALLLPDIKTPLPMLNYNHGTIFPSQEGSAPSYLGRGAELGIGKLFASNGYMVVLPDYIGYGETKAEKHPYGAYKLIASSAVDMLQAVKEFCVANKVSLSGKNFFSGWSEGAAVAMAVVKQLEQQPSLGIKPTGTVLNAGPYYSSAFIDHVLDAETSLRYMKTYVWVLQSYNWVYGLNKPNSYYFKAPYAAKLAKDAEADLPLKPADLFTREFTEAYRAGKDSLLSRALKENDLWDWKPQSKVVLCHGDQDDYVPVFNSEKAYSEMKAKGADVTLKIFKGQNHSSGAFAFLQVAFDSFEKLR